MVDRSATECVAIIGAAITPIVITPFIMLATLGFQPLWPSIPAGLLVLIHIIWCASIIHRLKR